MFDAYPVKGVENILIVSAVVRLEHHQKGGELSKTNQSINKSEEITTQKNVNINVK